MKTYTIAIAYEEGLRMDIEANSEEEANKKALELVSDYGQALRDNECKTDTVHRDFFVV